MKRLLSFFLALSMLLAITACGGKDSSDRNETEQEGLQISEDENEETDEPEDKEKDKSKDDDSDNTKQDSQNGSEEELSFEEMTVADNDQCLIQLKSIEIDPIWGYTIQAYIENKSSDTTYMFSLDNAAVNGVQTEPLFAVEVAAGKKSNEEINFADQNLTEQEIGDFTDIELSFRVYDSNDWTAEPVAHESVHIYPYGEEKATVFVREPQETDLVIVDNDAVTVILTGYDEDSIWGYSANLYLVNKTDKNLMFSVDEASVNGFMSDPFWAKTISAGKCGFSAISWTDSALEENGITAVEEIEMTFRVYDSEDWSADDVYNEVVTLKP